MEEGLTGCTALMAGLQEIQEDGAPISALIGGWLAEQHSEQISSLGMCPTHESQMVRKVPEILERMKPPALARSSRT